MKGIIKLRQNDGDPSPEARAQLGAAVDFVFKFAEYFLIAGVFGFLAKSTQNWAVTVIAVILMLLVTVHLLSLVSGLDYFMWREAKKKPAKFFLWLADAVIFVGIWYTLWTAFQAVGNTMLEGIGI